MKLADEDRATERISGSERRLTTHPDFIIAGCMKSGTTTLHHILAQHPRVFMPSGEVQLFTVDDIEQNPVFFIQDDGKWTFQDFERHFGEYARWHRSLYDEAEPEQIFGEDAPTYLPSRQAIDRIAEFLPDVKLIVMLRDPVDRIWSHYWHWVRTYRAIYTLEDTIRFQHGNLLQRSYYEDQLRYCQKKISASQIHVIIFEEFAQNQEAVVQRVLRFLGLRQHKAINEAVSHKGVSHKNKGTYPKHFRLALLRNQVLRNLYGRRYMDGIPTMPEKTPLPLYQRLLLRLHDMINPMSSRPPVAMEPETKEFLQNLLFHRNKGLPDLLESDLSAYWPTFQ